MDDPTPTRSRGGLAESGPGTLPPYLVAGNRFGSYGFGHTTLREPGDLRGTVVGRKGRYRVLYARGGEA